MVDTAHEHGLYESLTTRRSLITQSLPGGMATLAMAYRQVASRGQRRASTRTQLSTLQGATKMPHITQDIGVAKQIGAYSDALEARPNLRWLLTSGTPGLSTTGDLPKDITGQAEQAWEHIARMLERAQMTVADVVKVTQYLTRAQDIRAYVKVRSRFLGEIRPAFMLVVVPQLIRPEFLVEVEIVAARA
jgi:2-iminobutanoate/2-iminopropanoate deaminase